MKDFVAGIVPAAVGAVLLLVAGGFAADSAWFLAGAERTYGTTVAIEPTARQGGRSIIEFATPEGRRHRIKAWNARPPAYQVGERVRVNYRAGAPEQGRPADFTHFWLFPVVLGGPGLAALTLGVVVLALWRRRRKQERLRATGIALVGTVIEARTSSLQEWAKSVQYLTVLVVDPATGVTRQFVSHRVPGSGQEWVGRQLTVFVDSGDPGRYLVDAPKP
jgi:hypothetical protein